jgi:hypothetical protein
MSDTVHDLTEVGIRALPQDDVRRWATGWSLLGVAYYVPEAGRHYSADVDALFLLGGMAEAGHLDPFTSWWFDPSIGGDPKGHERAIDAGRAAGWSAGE